MPSKDTLSTFTVVLSQPLFFFLVVQQRADVRSPVLHEPFSSVFSMNELLLGAGVDGQRFLTPPVLNSFYPLSASQHLRLVGAP